MPILRTKIKVLFVAFCIISLVFPAHIAARSIDDIQREIDAQNQNLSSVQNQLSQAEKNLKNIEGSLNSVQGEIPRLEAEIKQIQAQVEVNKLLIQQSNETKKLKELEQEDRETRQVKAIKSAYQTWRSQNGIDTTIIYGTEGGMKHEVYQAEVSGKELSSIESLIAQIEKIKDDLANLEKQNGTLEEQNIQLAQRRQELIARMVALQTSRYSANGAVAGLRGQVAVIQSNISQLSAEQKALQDYEAWLLGQSGNGGTNPLTAGQLYFTGRGRDLLQGHGVGLSQFGAFGAANAGWNSTQILQLYYTGVSIVSSGGNVNVAGYGAMNVNDYVAGQGEVPAKACGDASQAAARPDKYVVDNPGTVWDCWPEEAIKAQAIAFRTYAMHWMSYKGGQICTTAACQVYNGTRNSQWVADETANLVITYGGQLIEALYSSDNNNGWGTANNETVFSNVDGSGTAVPYLRAVNDNNFAYKAGWNSWSWRTNSYTLNDGQNSIKSMLSFASGDGSLSSYQRSYIASINSQVGTISAINFDRDPSGRVTRVRITGTNGVTVVMAGWFFKAAWNSWVAATAPTGQADYIYSLTFFLLTAG